VLGISNMGTTFLFTTFVILLNGGLTWATTQSLSSISKFQLNSCNPKNAKCISVQADRADSGSTTPNMMLKNVVVKVKDTKNNSETTYTKSMGFYDIEGQRILISELTPKNSLKETVFQLKDASVQFMEMK
jgi:hypothetical protein